MCLLNIFMVAPWTDPSLPRAAVSCFGVTPSPGPACVFSDSCPIADRVSMSRDKPQTDRSIRFKNLPRGDVYLTKE